MIFLLNLYNIEENDWLQLNEIQPIANCCGKIIIIINYISLLIHIIIPKCTKNIIINQNQLISFNYQEIIKTNEYLFDDFQKKLKQTTNYLFPPNGNIFQILEILLKNINIVLILFTGIVNNKSHFHALQYKTEEERKQNSNYNNEIDINLSEYVGENNFLSSLEIESDNNEYTNNNSIIPNNNEISLKHTNIIEKK
jgi:hypothetical protein